MKKDSASISRRGMLHRVAAAGALPFMLQIPSRAGAVTPSEAALRPFLDREEEFRRSLRAKLAKAGTTKQSPTTNKAAATTAPRSTQPTVNGPVRRGYQYGTMCSYDCGRGR